MAQRAGKRACQPAGVREAHRDAIPGDVDSAILDALTKRCSRPRPLRKPNHAVARQPYPELDLVQAHGLGWRAHRVFKPGTSRSTIGATRTWSLSRGLTPRMGMRSTKGSMTLSTTCKPYHAGFSKPVGYSSTSKGLAHRVAWKKAHGPIKGDVRFYPVATTTVHQCQSSTCF